jgi:hypothetical protein
MESLFDDSDAPWQYETDDSELFKTRPSPILIGLIGVLTLALAVAAIVLVKTKRLPPLPHHPA